MLYAAGSREECRLQVLERRREMTMKREEEGARKGLMR